MILLTPNRSGVEAGIYTFSRISPSSQKKYGLTLTKLIFALIRFYVRPANEWTTTFKYPAASVLPENILNALHALADSLVASTTLTNALAALQQSEMMPEAIYFLSAEGQASTLEDQLSLLHTALLALFRHRQNGLATPFYSPVITFYVTHMIGEGGLVQSTSSITNIAAHLMYILRGCFGLEAVEKARTSHIQIML